MKNTYSPVISLGTLTLRIPMRIAAPSADRVDDLGPEWTAIGMNKHGDVCGAMPPDGSRDHFDVQALLAGFAADC